MEEPRSTSVEGGVMASPFVEGFASAFPPEESPLEDPETGDHATAVMACRNRKGRGLLDWTAGLPGLIGR